MSRKLAILFNLELDANSVLLSSNVGWVEEFANNYDRLWVIATHVGKIPQDLNGVDVVELGGGSFLRRILAVVKLTKIIFKVMFSGVRPDVFHHMSHRTVIYPGLFFRLFGLRQIMWYSHARRANSLNLASRIVDYVVSPTVESFPIKSSKVRPVGQAVKTKNFFMKPDKDMFHNRRQLLSVGRISTAKKIDSLVENQSLKISDCFSELVLAGPIFDEDYLNSLIGLATKNGWNVQTLGPIEPYAISEIHKNFTFYFMGTPKAIDRAAIEACCSGLIPVSNNKGLMFLTGMAELWRNLGYEEVPDLMTQLEVLANLDDRMIDEMRRRISSESKMRNDFNVTCQKIIDLFED